MIPRRYKLVLAAHAPRNYERILAMREVRGLVPGVKILAEQKQAIVVETGEKNAARKMQRLAFISGVLHEDKLSPTIQNRIERADAAGGKSRNIRYYMHSLHEYKGRFYPQLAKALMNIAGGGKGVVLDPFCGCGTLLLEAALSRTPAVGVDINPAGWMITRAKIAATRLGGPDIQKINETFSVNFSRAEKKIAAFGGKSSERDENYLRHWFPGDNLKKLLVIDGVIQSSFSGNARIFLSAVLSSILRRFSFQEPGEQRIRRRKDAPPSDVYEAFAGHLFAHLDKIHKIRAIAPYAGRSAVAAHLGDARAIPLPDNSIDCVVTSPPYATALPYIDADRLSLFFMSYADKEKFRALERAMIGNREISAREKAKWESLICRPSPALPDEVTDLLTGVLRKNQDARVGFRRKNTAALLCRYFCDMRESLIDMRRVLKSSARMALVVGDNFTIAGGEKTEIPTARFINLIAQKSGFRLLDVIPMTPSAPYNIYSKNAIRREYISFLEAIK